MPTKFEGADPESYLGAWRCGNEPRPASQWQGENMPRYCSEAYDRLLAEMAVTGDVEERARLARAMNDMLVQDYVLIPLVHRGRVSAHARSLGGVRLNTWGQRTLEHRRLASHKMTRGCRDTPARRAAPGARIAGAPTPATD